MFSVQDSYRVTNLSEYICSQNLDQSRLLLSTSFITDFIPHLPHFNITMGQKSTSMRKSSEKLLNAGSNPFMFKTDKPGAPVVYMFTPRLSPYEGYRERLYMPQEILATGSLCEVYSELCRQIYEFDKGRGFTMPIESETDIYLSITLYEETTPMWRKNPKNKELAKKIRGLRKPKCLIGWMLENYDWQKELIERFWNFPRMKDDGSAIVLPWYTLQVEYKSGARGQIYKDFLADFQWRGITLDEFISGREDKDSRFGLENRDSGVDLTSLVWDGDMLESDGLVIVRDEEPPAGDEDGVKGDGYICSSGRVPARLIDITEDVPGMEAVSRYGVLVSEAANPFSDEMALIDFDSILDGHESVIAGTVMEDFGGPMPAKDLEIDYSWADFEVGSRDALIDVFGEED